MPVIAYLPSINLLQNLDLTLGGTEIVAFVGPNNAGKSQTLQDIRSMIMDDKPTTVVAGISKIILVTPDEEIEAIVRDLGRKKGHFQSGRHAVGLDQVRTVLSQKRHHYFGGLLLSDLTTRSRLSDVDPVDAIDPRDIGAHTHPFHLMFRRNQIEEKVSDLFYKAFGQDLVMFRAAGTKASAYIGVRPERAQGEHVTDGSYLDKVETLSPLENEGDGVRSYASIIGRLVTEERPIQLIDEPEAFLHPPQARKIGVAIGENSVGRQTFIATHSKDVLQGLIAAAPDRVSVVRLARFGEARTANHITSQDIKALWDDPILRYSQVLDGLFHDAVIVAESDYDCRFFQAVMEVSTSESRPDFHYVQVNGKSRMHLVIHALAKVGVPVASIFDFDILNAEQPLRRTIEASGGEWEEFKSDWKVISGKVGAKSTVKLVKDVVAEVRAILKRIQPQAIFEKAASKDIEAAIRIDQPWDQIREVGLDGLYAYGCYNEGKNLLDRLKTIGVFIVPVGQMEGFDREEAARKGNWVNAVLQGDLMHERLLKARSFVAELAKWAATPPEKRKIDVTVSPKMVLESEAKSSQ